MILKKILTVLYETIELLICNMFGSVLDCYQLTGVDLLRTRRALANKATIRLVWKYFGLYKGVDVDCVLIVNFRGYLDLLGSSVMVFVNTS